MKHVFPTLLSVFFLAASASEASTKAPDCDGPQNYPAVEALLLMEKAGITTNAAVDFTRTKSRRLASQQIGKDLYRQVHLVTYRSKDGRALEAITVNDASSDECSMGNVQVFVVSTTLGAEPNAP